MRDTVAFCDAAQRAELSAQFPRWNTLLNLLRNDVAGQRFITERPPDNAILVAQLAWQMFNQMSVACKPLTLCARRGCSRAGTLLCDACKIIQYCGPKCRKRYAFSSISFIQPASH